jgi:uncharacterized membrane protein YidH (DUF202 family)
MIRFFWLGLVIFTLGAATTVRSVRYFRWNMQDGDADEAFGEFILIVLSVAIVVIGVCMMLPFVVTELDL